MHVKHWHRRFASGRKTSTLVPPALLRSALAACLLCGSAVLADPPPATPLVTGKRITLPPLGVQQNVGSLPMNLLLSPDGRYAVSSDMGLRQSLWSIRTSDGVGVSHVDFPNNPGPNATTNGLYYGLAFAPDGTLYAAQGNNDTILILKISSGGALTTIGQITTKKGDFPSGLALDGRGYLYVANNDPSTFAVPSSVAIYNLVTKTEVGRFSFNSNGTPNFPYAVQVLNDGSKLYVASQRDGAVYVLGTQDPTAPTLLKTLSTGSHPDSLLLNKKQDRLYVANAHSDTVSLVYTQTDYIATSALLRPRRLGGAPGATPTGLALSPDEKRLFVTLGDLNAVAVLNTNNFDVLGYIPTGWYPSTPAVSGDGAKLLVANAKGVTPRNPDVGYQLGHFETDPKYIQNIIEGTVQTISLPNELNRERLGRFTEQVLDNNKPTRREGDDIEHEGDDGEKVRRDHRLDKLGLAAGPNARIKHVIFIIKENRTYDQVLGDVPQGNGDPSLVLFGSNVTPNQHAIAQRFLLLDNFFDCGEVSGDGWPWSTQGLANEYVIKDLPYNYSDRGRNYDFEGQNNGYLCGGFPSHDPDGKLLSDLFPNGLPPITDVAQSPGGHIWDLAKSAGLSYRDYGMFYSFGVTQFRTPPATPLTVLPDNYPCAAGLLPPDHDLKGVSDFDYRRYDNDYPDSDAPQKYGAVYARTTYGKHNAPSRFSEWNNEFQQMLAKDPTGGAVPNLMLVRFNHDHTQSAAPGKFSPRAEVADNDYAVGQLVEAISKSPIWSSTAIFAIEDDAQDGQDHVDAHRSTCYVISPYIPAGSIDHTFYNTDSVLKTIEMLLGLPPMTQYDAAANPILDFGSNATNNAPFGSILPAQNIITEKNPTLLTLHTSDPVMDLLRRSARMDFDHPDSAPSQEVNEIIWKLTKGVNTPVPKPVHASAFSLVAKPSALRGKIGEAAPGTNRQNAAHDDDD